MSYAKDRGTRAETAAGDWLQDELGVEVMRRVMYGGGNDRGDIVITGVPYMLEIKNRKTPNLPAWGVEVARQTANVGAPYGALLWSPPGLGVRSIERWIVLEWHGTHLGEWWRKQAYTFTAPASRLASVMKARDDSPVLYHPDDYLWRARHAARWLEDLQELVIMIGPTRTEA